MPGTPVPGKPVATMIGQPLPLSPVDENTVWSVLSKETETVDLVGETVEIPNEAARCAIVALHAAQHGIGQPAIFGDLEKVVPYNVRLVSVKLPQVNSDNAVQLDMMVGAESFAPVLELLKRLETSPQFGPTSVVNSLPPSQTDKLWKYRVSVSYAQKL